MSSSKPGGDDQTTPINNSTQPPASEDDNDTDIDNHTDTDNDNDNDDHRISQSVNNLLRAYSNPTIRPSTRTSSLSSSTNQSRTLEHAKSVPTLPTALLSVDDDIFSLPDGLTISRSDIWSNRSHHFHSLADNDAGSSSSRDDFDLSKYIDMAPCLRIFCPCFCCLYPVEDDEDDSLPPLWINKNIFILLLFSLCYGISDSIISGTAFSGYVVEVSAGKNAYVGYFEAVRVISRLLSMIVLQGSTMHVKVLRFGGVFTIVSMGLNLWLIDYIGEDNLDTNEHKVNRALMMYYFLMALRGFLSSFAYAPVINMFQTCLPDEQIEAYMVIQIATLLLGTILGPLLSIFFFAAWGDEWTLECMRNVLEVGIVLMMISGLLMCCVRKRWILTDSEMGVVPEEDETTANISTASFVSKMMAKENWIPLILVLSSTIIVAGTGMTIRLFPLYFKDDVELYPTVVQFAYFMVPGMSMVASMISQCLAKSMDKLPTLLFTKITALTSLFMLAFLTSNKASVGLVIFFIIKSAFMSFTFPYDLEGRVWMQLVADRGRWIGLEKLGMLYWAGCAVIGGVVADSEGYTYVVKVMAILQTVGVAGYILLYFLVKDEHIIKPEQEGISLPQNNSGDNNSISMDSEEESELSQPLIEPGMTA